MRGGMHRHSQRAGDIGVHKAHRILHALQQRDMRTCQRTKFIDQTIALHGDMNTHQRKLANLRRANGVHRIGDQHKPILAQQAIGSKQTIRMTMHAVGNNAAIQPQRRRTADGAGIASFQRRHGIEQMRHSRQPFARRAFNRGMIGHAVAKMNLRNMRLEARNHARRHLFGRQRQNTVLQKLAITGINGEIAFIRGAQKIGAMRAFLRRMEKRPLKMAANNPRHAVAYRPGNTGNCGMIFFLTISNKRRQHRHRAKLTMAGKNLRQRIRIIMLVDQQTRAAIGLGFHKTGA